MSDTFKEAPKMSETFEENSTNEISNKTLTKYDLEKPCGHGDLFLPFLYHHTHFGVKEEHVHGPIDDILNKIQNATNVFANNFITLLSSEKNKFNYSYHIKIYNKKDCKPLKVYPNDYLRNIFTEIYGTTKNETLKKKKEKIFKSTYNFLNEYLPIFERKIDEFEIQIRHNIDFTETVKIFYNDKNEVENLVYGYLKSLKEIISKIEYKSTSKKVNNDKERVLNYLNGGLELMQCKFLGDGNKAEPCYENYKLSVERQYEESTPFVKNITANNLNMSLDENLQLAINSSIIGNKESNQSLTNPSVVIILGCVSSVILLAFLIFTVLNYLIDRIRRKNEQNVETEMVYLVS